MVVFLIIVVVVIFIIKSKNSDGLTKKERDEEAMGRRMAQERIEEIRKAGDDLRSSKRQEACDETLERIRWMNTVHACLAYSETIRDAGIYYCGKLYPDRCGALLDDLLDELIDKKFDL